jgi:hypothetical protein
VFLLEHLLAPVNFDEFINDYWEVEPWHVERKNCGSYYDGLFRLDLLDKLATHASLKYPEVKLVKEGALLPASKFAKIVTYGGEDIRGVLDWELILREFHSGASLIYNRMHEYVPSLSRLAQDIESQFTSRCHVNGYLTPPNGQGFDAHYDTHDVFILQIAGHKTWTLHPPTIELPLAGDWCELPDPLGEPLGILQVTAGDLLYIPRGFVHSAVASDLLSFHLTVGVEPHTWVDAFRQLVRLCRKDVRFRQALRPGYLVNDAATSQFDIDFKDVLKKLSESASSRAISQGLIRDFKPPIAPIFPGRVLDALNADQIGIHSVLHSKNVEFIPTSETTEKFSIYVKGRDVDLLPEFKESLRFISTNAAFAVGNLPGQITDTQRLELARLLIREGVLEIYRGSNA